LGIVALVLTEMPCAFLLYFSVLMSRATLSELFVWFLLLFVMAALALVKGN